LQVCTAKKEKNITTKLGDGAPIKIYLEKVQLNEEDKYSNIIR